MDSKLDFLYEMLKQEYTHEELEKIVKGYNSTRPLTFRVNKLKSTKEEIEEFLEKENINYELVSWYPDAFIIKDKVNLEDYSIYQEGKIYLQSLSSMIPVLFLDLKENDSVLDMCSSPGGKTTQMASITNNSVLITAVEKNKIRSERLKYNIEKQGVKRVNIMNVDARRIDDYFKFDKILLDAPCSGSGTLYLNDKNIQDNFTTDLINRSIKVQRELLKKASKLLKKDGILVYSTCSILKEENEANVEMILKDKTLELIEIDKNILAGVPLLTSNIDGVISVCPSNLYEGFFVAKFKKR